jgi:phosphoglycolate phosphatase
VTVLLRAVVFDLDGTLVDSKIDYEKMAARIRDILAGAGVIPEKLADRRMIYQIIRGGDSALSEAGVHEEDRPTIRIEMEKIMNTIEMEGVGLSKPMVNAEETLCALKAHGLGIGVATRGCHQYAIESMRLTNLQSYIDVCLARDDVPYPKPDPRHLLDVINALRSSPDSVFYIGDTQTDLDTAVAAKVQFIGYKRDEAWGRRLREAGCSFMVDDLLQIVEVACNST